jgi:hypothetical protein
MERFYATAKLLSEFDEKISFESYIENKENKEKADEKQNKNYLQRMISMFSLFEKK